MFAAAAPLPFYSSHGFAAVGRSATKPAEKDASTVASRPVAGSPNANDANGSTGSLKDLIEPAVNAPPPPERLRALNDQVKRGSLLDSESSTTKSITTDRPSWEHGTDQMTLSRRSSGRSTASSKPSRDRPESVQIFGKTIFNRRGKMKRESSANSSSGSSLYSTDVMVDGTAPSAKEQPVIPNLFGRRKAAKSDASTNRPRSNSASSRKLLISSPYNFQHVTHTRRDHLPNPHGASRADMMSDFSAVQSAPPPQAGSLGGVEADELRFPDFALEPQISNDDGSHLLQTSPVQPSSQLPSPLRRSRVNSLPRRLLKRSQSSERLSVAAPRSAPPPRPPRSPAEASSSPLSAFPPVPPPRMSSRTSTRLNGLDPLVTHSLDRPQTSGGFRQPQPFSPSVDSWEPPSTAHGYPEHFADSEEYPDSPFSHALTTPDDAAWPLSSNTATFSYDAALPDVPEEDENNTAVRRSRLSFTSNKSSLRGSHSLPLLRQSAQLQATGHQRPPSGMSDTLGRLEPDAARDSPDSAIADDVVAANSPRESWEDDIDYCYEHEADADFNYAWERPSFDVSREAEPISSMTDGHTEARGKPRLSATIEDLGEAEQHSIALNTVPARDFETPTLSPASPAPSVNAQEAITPVLTLPEETDAPIPQKVPDRRKSVHLHVRTSSRASSFKESHGFTLSPSLLIPGDFHQQLVMARTNSMDSYPDDLPSPGGPLGLGESSPLVMSTSGMFIHDRASTATTRSNSSVYTGSSGEHHISSHSSFTAPTRYTGSTVFEGWDPKALESAEPVPAVQLEDFPEITSPQAQCQFSNAPISPVADSGRPGHAVSQSASNIGDMSRGDGLAHQAQAKGKGPVARQRQRAHTTSLSSPNGGYALFPKAYTGNRI